MILVVAGVGVGQSGMPVEAGAVVVPEPEPGVVPPVVGVVDPEPVEGVSVLAAVVVPAVVLEP